MVQPDGRVKLLDFGIARLSRAETHTFTLTAALPEAMEAGQIRGTLGYMAPEQWRGDEIDTPADLFSFGVMLYEMATGHRPFPGPTAAALMAQVLHEAAPQLSVLLPSIPAALARIVHCLIEKRPASRYPSAHELHVDLVNLGRELDLGTAPPASVAGKRAIAVLPFKLLTPNPEDEYLSVALADAVISQLSPTGEFLLRPTHTVMRYAKAGTDPLLAARELNVQVIVEGSIQKLGERLRVHVQAWNAVDGSKLLSAKHDAEMVDLFGLQDNIIDSLARALGSKVPQDTEAASPPTKSTKAYEFYLRAVERLARLNRWDMRTAIEMLQSATELDPRFADAWARLAEACLQMEVTFEPGPQWFRRAEQAIRRALVIDPHNAEAKSAQAQVLWTPGKRFQNRAAMRALQEALELNPGCHQARIWQGLIFFHIGLMEEAKESLRTTLATNPHDARTMIFMGHSSHYQGKYDEAEEWYARSLSLDPASLWGNILSPNVFIYSRQFDRAAERIEAGLKVLPGESTLASAEALLWAVRGEKKRAEKGLQRALRGERPLLHTHHMWHNAAVTCALIGKPAEAMSMLKKCGSLGLPNYPLFRDEPFLKSLHSHPQFLRFMAGLKREWMSYREEFGAEADAAS
jgi:eukaryotic-like serine/threonine-protein kinase